MTKEKCNNCRFYSREHEVCLNRIVNKGEYLEYRYKNTPACWCYQLRPKKGKKS